MADIERDFVPYVPVNGAPPETIFSDTYREVGAEDTDPRTWTDLAYPRDFGEYTFVVFSAKGSSDKTVAYHNLHGNASMEWWGTNEEPVGIFSSQEGPDMLDAVRQQIADSDLKLLDSTRRVNIIFMNPSVFGIAAKEHRTLVLEQPQADPTN